MTRIDVNPSLEKQLGGMNEPLEFYSDGRVVGHYLPEAEYRKMIYASYAIQLSDEEIARRRAETGGATLAEIWKELGRE